jgi:ech hydrogenase subunit A
MNGEFILALTVILPVFTGLLILISGKSITKIVVPLMALVLGTSSILILRGGEFSFSPNPVFQSVVMILDIALLVCFLFVGFKKGNYLILLLSGVQALMVGYFELAGGGGHSGSVLIVDGLSTVLLLIINIVGSIVCLYALSYMDEHEEHLHLERSRQPRFFFFLLLLLGAMNGLVVSNNLFWLYFFWEVTTLCCFELIRHDGGEVAEANADRALWMGLVGGVALLGALYIGNFHFHTISMDVLIIKQPTHLLLVAFSLMAVAAFTKSAQLPFQSWLLGAMVAPTPVSALLHSSTMVNVGVFLILRFVPAIGGTYLTYGIALVGVFTFMFTAIVALSQRFSKAILAYSTIGNLGLIIFCAAMNTPHAYTAALILLVFHSMSKGLLFLCAGVIENRLHSRNIEDWEGLLERLPLTTVVMVTGITSMILPMFGVLLGKWAAVGVASSAPMLIAMAMITMMVVGSSATTLFWAKWLGNFTILPITESRLKLENLPLGFSFSMLLILALDVVTSLGSGFLIQTVVFPAVAPHYDIVWFPGLLGISSQLGSFMILPLWVAIAITIVGGMMLMKVKGGEIKPAYMSGENVEGNPIAFRSTADSVVDYRIAGMFFDPAVTEGRWNPWGTVAGILMNLLVLGLVMV